MPRTAPQAACRSNTKKNLNVIRDAAPYQHLSWHDVRPSISSPSGACPCYGQHRQTDRQTDRQTHTHTPARALAPARTRAQTHGQEPESSANYRERQHSTQRHTLVGVTLRPLRLETVVWRQVRFSHCVANQKLHVCTLQLIRVKYW